MNSTDKKLYELFTPYDIELDGIVEDVQLHDVFRVAKEEKIHCTLMSNGVINFHREMSLFEDIPYNSTLPLLQQENSTKESIIKLFEN